MEARHASYLELADRIRQRFDHHQVALLELFARLWPGAVLNDFCFDGWV